MGTALVDLLAAIRAAGKANWLCETDSGSRGVVLWLSGSAIPTGQRWERIEIVFDREFAIEAGIAAAQSASGPRVQRRRLPQPSRCPKALTAPYPGRCPTARRCRLTGAFTRPARQETGGTGSQEMAALDIPISGP